MLSIIWSALLLTYCNENADINVYINENENSCDTCSIDSSVIADSRIIEYFDSIVDASINKEISSFSSINIGLVKNSNIIVTNSYGESNLNEPGVYASVSKPVTAVIVLKFLQEGLIKSLDDNIWEYSDYYIDCMPEEYSDSPLTIRHLLMHQSGLIHSRDETWVDGKLNLLFEPGTGYNYTTGGYAILGDVLAGAKGQDYEEILKEYIAEPIGATSFTTWEWWSAPGAGIYSTISEMAEFTVGLFENIYLDPNTFNMMFSPECMGWMCTYNFNGDIILYHPGSNGNEKAYIGINPRTKNSVVIQAKGGSLGIISGLTFNLLDALDRKS